MSQTTNTPSSSSSFRTSEELLKHNQPLNIITKEIYSFIQSFGNEADKLKHQSEDKLFVQIVINLFGRLDSFLGDEDKGSAILFVETEDEMDKYSKMAYVLQQHPSVLPQLIRSLALDLDSFMSLESKADSYPLYSVLTDYANEFEKVMELLVTQK